MGLFKHKADPFKDGLQTTATVERVHDTGRFISSGGVFTQREQMEETQVYFVFRLADGTVFEKAFLLPTTRIPRPGTQLCDAFAQWPVSLDRTMGVADWFLTAAERGNPQTVIDRRCGIGGG